MNGSAFLRQASVVLQNFCQVRLWMSLIAFRMQSRLPSLTHEQTACPDCVHRVMQPWVMRHQAAPSLEERQEEGANAGTFTIQAQGTETLAVICSQTSSGCLLHAR